VQVVILSGGLGTRLAEETAVVPKPMIEIGGEPILLHIMKGYAHYGFDEFILALGYKGEIIKDYFLNYHFHQSNLTVDLSSGEVDISRNHDKDWTVRLIDTGLNTLTGGRQMHNGFHVFKMP